MSFVSDINFPAVSKDEDSEFNTEIYVEVCPVPAPCLRSSAAEFVDVCADDSFRSSIGSATKNTETRVQHTHTTIYTHM